MNSENAIASLPRKINADLFRLFDSFDKTILSGCGNTSSKAFIMADFLREIKGQSLVWVVNDAADLEFHKKMINFWTNTEVHDFQLDPNMFNDKEVNRRNQTKITNFISKINEPKKQIILTTYTDFLTATPDKKELEQSIWTIKKKDQSSLVEIFEKLISLNYENASNPVVEQGEYYCRGNLVSIYPFNSDYPIRVTVDFDEVTEIEILDQAQQKQMAKIEEAVIYPLLESKEGNHFTQYINENNIFIEDEIEVVDDHFDIWNQLTDEVKAKRITFNTFNEDEENHSHFYYASTLKFHTVHDFISDIKDKKLENWKIIIATKNETEIKNILEDKNVVFISSKDSFREDAGDIQLMVIPDEQSLPLSFQNPTTKITLLTDKDIAEINKEKKHTKSDQKVYLDLLTSLKKNDLVVHTDHGIARFLGLDRKEVDGITKEYLKLGYAENDKLFVPIDQADRVTRYIGDEETAPKLTRLGSAEWSTITSKVKKETEKIAKELLKLYAARKNAKGFKFTDDNDIQSQFEETFPYEETPGQIRAILDTKRDMERPLPMDRLVCGDVGFGKTEVAMRAAFKAVQNKKQVAFISPITILADQHYESFKKRMEPFHVRVEMMSRFKSKKEQNEILKKLEKGEVDIVIGTHRLIQPDVKFKNLGLVIIDEEQRFGVKQKEKLTELRTEVDILTLTATPIPRTLNIALNKLRDITTITTPPPGRLPVITEVRKFSETLIRDAIQRELDRNGQAYVLHNRVQTIASFTEKLKKIVPNARFIYAHGKLSASELEARILAFKKGEYDVLVSSTIIENGIDLASANTLIVNQAERFGLSQLYQLRGRVGRSKTQAYAYFLYHGQRLKLDAKKRLRAIVEASDLGSGFQIAMKDLEIRGAGEILGANQSGTMSVVGVSHFMRMLNRAVEDLKSGRSTSEDGEIKEVAVELPINAYIPDNYIVNSKDKINTYQKLSSADTKEYLAEIREDLEHEYGKMPPEVANLIRIIELKQLAKSANLTNIKVENMPSSRGGKQIVLSMSDKVRPENIGSLLDYNDKWLISGTKLKISIESLGAHWFEELINSIEALSKEKKVG